MVELIIVIYGFILLIVLLFVQIIRLFYFEGSCKCLKKRALMQRMRISHISTPIDMVFSTGLYKEREVNKNVKNILLSMCDVKLLLTFTSLNLVLL